MGTLNFPEIWLDRVIEQLTSANSAPWLDGIAELDAEVLEVGTNSASEQNVVHIPLSTFEPDVLINNTAKLDIQTFSDSEVTLQLEKYQTKATSVTDDQIIGAAYDRVDSATRNHVVAITKKKLSRAIWRLAPADHSSAHVVINTTGTATTGQRQPLVYNDLIALKGAFDDMQCPADGRRLVLSTEHQNDLLLDRERFGDILFNYSAGKPAPVIAGFQIYSYINNPYYTFSTGDRIAFDAAATGTERRASVAFYAGNVAKKTGMTKQYFRPSALDPENQRNLLNYRHYFITTPLQNKYSGAIVSKNKA